MYLYDIHVRVFNMSCANITDSCYTSRRLVLCI